MFRKWYSIFVAATMMFCVTSAAAMTDPMQPPNYGGIKSAKGKKELGDWQLTSILISNKRRLATINGKNVAIGEKINGAQVIDINTASVTILFQGRKIAVKLLPLVVKSQRDASME